MNEWKQLILTLSLFLNPGMLHNKYANAWSMSRVGCLMESLISTRSSKISSMQLVTGVTQAVIWVNQAWRWFCKCDLWFFSLQRWSARQFLGCVDLRRGRNARWFLRWFDHRSVRTVRHLCKHDAPWWLLVSDCRKGGMFLNNIVSTLAYIFMFISKPVHSYEVLIIGRFFLGLACGTAELSFFSVIEQRSSRLRFIGRSDVHQWSVSTQSTRYTWRFVSVGCSGHFILLASNQFKGSIGFRKWLELCPR